MDIRRASPRDAKAIANGEHEVAKTPGLLNRKWQRLGIGRQLLTFAIQWAGTSAKVEKIELMVRASNEPATRLYRSMGFVEEGRIRNRVKDASGIYHDDIAMGLFV